MSSYLTFLQFRTSALLSRVHRSLLLPEDTDLRFHFPAVRLLRLLRLVSAASESPVFGWACFLFPEPFLAGLVACGLSPASKRGALRGGLRLSAGGTSLTGGSVGWLLGPALWEAPLSVSARLPPGQTLPWRGTLHHRAHRVYEIAGGCHEPRCHTWGIDSRATFVSKLDVGGGTSTVTVFTWLALFR